jgi:hypothetical protein
MTVFDSEKNPLHLQVFLASPADVSEERRLAQEILEELPRTQAFRGLVTVEVFRYDDERARTGLPLNFPPQQGITHTGHRPADCDFTVAFLWSRLGTPLPPTDVRSDGRHYASGTEWEIEDALSAGKEVYLYVRTEQPGFLRAPAANEGAYEEHAQYARVQDFLGRFSSAGGAPTGAIQRYSDPSVLRETFAQHMSGVFRRRLDLANQRNDAKRFRRAGALAIATAAMLAAGWYVVDRVWFDRPEVSIDQVERCDLIPSGKDATLSFQFSFQVTHQRAVEAAYVELARTPSFEPPVISYKQDQFSAQKRQFWEKWVKQPVWNGWLRVTVRDGQQKLRGASPAVPLECKEGGA